MTHAENADMILSALTTTATTARQNLNAPGQATATARLVFQTEVQRPGYLPWFAVTAIYGSRLSFVFSGPRGELPEIHHQESSARRRLIELLDYGPDIVPLRWAQKARLN